MIQHRKGPWTELEFDWDDAVSDGFGERFVLLREHNRRDSQSRSLCRFDTHRLAFDVFSVETLLTGFTEWRFCSEEDRWCVLIGNPSQRKAMVHVFWTKPATAPATCMLDFRDPRMTFLDEERIVVFDSLDLASVQATTIHLQPDCLVFETAIMAIPPSDHVAFAAFG
jgi:hypothetical protein